MRMRSRGRREEKDHERESGSKWEATGEKETSRVSFFLKLTTTCRTPFFTISLFRFIQLSIENTWKNKIK